MLVTLHLCANGDEFASERRTGRGGQEPPKGFKWEWGVKVQEGLFGGESC